MVAFQREDKIKLDQNHSIVNDHLLTNQKVVTVEKEANCEQVCLFNHSGKTAVKHLGCFVDCLLRKSCIVVVGNFSGFLFVCLFNNSGKVAMTPLLL